MDAPRTLHGRSTLHRLDTPRIPHGHPKHLPRTTHPRSADTLYTPRSPTAAPRPPYGQSPTGAPPRVQSMDALRTVHGRPTDAPPTLHITPHGRSTQDPLTPTTPQDPPTSAPRSPREQSTETPWAHREQSTDAPQTLHAHPTDASRTPHGRYVTPNEPPTDTSRTPKGRPTDDSPPIRRHQLHITTSHGLPTPRTIHGRLAVRGRPTDAPRTLHGTPHGRPTRDPPSPITPQDPTHVRPTDAPRTTPHGNPTPRPIDRRTVRGHPTGTPQELHVTPYGPPMDTPRTPKRRPTDDPPTTPRHPLRLTTAPRPPHGPSTDIPRTLYGRPTLHPHVTSLRAVHGQPASVPRTPREQSMGTPRKPHPTETPRAVRTSRGPIGHHGHVTDILRTVRALPANISQISRGHHTDSPCTPHAHSTDGPWTPYGRPTDTSLTSR